MHRESDGDQHLEIGPGQPLPKPRLAYVERMLTAPWRGVAVELELATA